MNPYEVVATITALVWVWLYFCRDADFRKARRELESWERGR